MSDTVTKKPLPGLVARLGAAFQAIFPPAGPEVRERPQPAASLMTQRRQDALAVLSAARGVVDRGWVQNRWYVIQTPGGRRRPFRPAFSTRLDHTLVVQACLVGAVFHAAWQQSSEREHAYPAIDALWYTLQEGDATVGSEPLNRVSSPRVRAARIRDLTIWNDRRDRTKDHVLHLLDRTAARVAGSPGSIG
jgi:hypothetical protein